MYAAITASQSRRPRRLLRFLLRTALTLALLVLFGIATLLVLVRHEHGAELTLPVPTGPFAVGRTTYSWANSEQHGTQPPQAQQEVLVWIWYPADRQPAKPADYLPAPWRNALAQASGPLMSHYLTRDLALVHAHSTTDANLSAAQSSYPVVIMRAGGAALTIDYTTLAEDLASHGYVVIGFDAPYRTFTVVFPDGRVANRLPENNIETQSATAQASLINKLLSMWTADTKFVVDQLDRLNAADPSGRFTGHLDMKHLGMFGHSFGGATALQFCHEDVRCKAGMDIDGEPFGSVLQDAPHQPFFFLLSDHGDLSAPDTREVFGKIKSVYDRLPAAKLLLMVRGANHFSFTDQILLKSHYIIGPMQFFRRGPDSRRGLAITAAYVHTFFDIYLKGEQPEELEPLRQTYPEIQPPTKSSE